MVMQNLVNYIFLSLSSAIINVVPILYGMFKVLSNIQIVDYNDSSNIIFNVWNNLYILLSVLILFAIAIKLVNAIVNPDVLTDNKKGVKKAFFNALISVFLVVLLPFVFRGFHEVQSHILNNDIIPKFVFQSETQEDGGNMLAWMAISSTIDLEAFDEIDLIEDLDLVEYGDGTGIYIPADPEEHDPKWLLTELSILRPWANPVIQAAVDAYLDIHPVVLFIFLVATIYELLILVLDTALRTFKLLLLEMMTPIVLGAYVFKSEILKSWALEYIKTFLQIFLLVLALCFMEYMVPLVSGLLQIDGIFHMPSTFLIIGIFRLLLYIGLLRLVKQIGPLINKIFGTNIQAKGGIKGRLGEMAAVGGIAQKAWSSLGNTAKNAGKLAIAAPFVGAGLGANALYKSKTGRNLTDHKYVRGAKAALSGISTAAKTGDWLKAKDAAKSTFDKTSATALDKARLAQRINQEDDDILFDGDTVNNESAIKDTRIAKKDSANAKYKKKIRQIGGKKVADANDKYEGAIRAQGIAKGVEKANAGITENLQNAMSQYAQGDARSVKISEALNKYKNDGNTRDLTRFILQNKDIIKDEEIIKNLIGENGAILTKNRLINEARRKQTELGLSNKDIADLGRGEKAISFLANTTLEGKVSSAKTFLDTAILGANLSELDKMDLEAKISSNKALVDSYAFAIGRSDSANGLSRGLIGGNPYSNIDLGSEQAPAPAPAPTPTPTPAPQQDFGAAPDYWGNPNVVGTGPTPMETPVVPELNAQNDTPIVNVDIHNDQPNLNTSASTKTETIITNNNTETYETETSEKKQESSSSDKSEPVTVKVESEEISAADILAKALDRNTNTMNKMGKEMNNLADSVSEKPKDKNE